MLLFPAYAGVIPYIVLISALIWPFPRVCGGDPIPSKVAPILEDFSPRMRG